MDRTGQDTDRTDRADVPNPLNIVCLYHADCMDGFAAAWAVREYFGRDIELHAVRYGGPIPKIPKGSKVLIVDFSYPKDVLESMLEEFELAWIVVIDHHKTAEKELESYLTINTEFFRGDRINKHPRGIYKCFDMDQSGAGLTYRTLYGGTYCPYILAYIEDYDLRRFQFEHTMIVNNYLRSYPFDWKFLSNVVDTVHSQLDTILAEGRAIARKHAQDAEYVIKTAAFRAHVQGFDVPMINVSKTLTDSVGNALAIGEPFAVCYYDKGDIRYFSLRSDKHLGEDVSKIAKLYGGGGHRNSAGFSIQLYPNPVMFEIVPGEPA